MANFYVIPVATLKQLIVHGSRLSHIVSESDMKSSIVTRIDVVEAEIAQQESRLDEIERTLRIGDVDYNQRTSLKAEESDIKKNIDEKRLDLKQLRKENMKSMFLSVVILLFIAVVYVAICD